MLVFQTLVSSVAVPAHSLAEDNGDSVFTSMALTDKDGNEIESKSDAAYVLINWSIKEVDVESGSTETIHLPQGLRVESEQTGSLADEETEVGTFLATSDGIVTVTFTEEVEAHNEAEGSFRVAVLTEEETDETGKDPVEVEEELSAKEDSDSPLEEPNKTEVDEGEKQEEVEIEDQREVEVEQKEATNKSITTYTDEIEITENLLTNVNLYQRFLDDEEDRLLEPGQEIVVDHPFDEFKVTIQYEFELPNNHGYSDGSTYTIEVPDIFRVLPNPEEMELRAPDGTMFGTFIVNNQNEIVITFNENIENNSNVSGYIQLWSEFAAHYSGPAEGNEIVFPITGEEAITYPVKFLPDASAIDKRGVPDKSYNSTSITWTVDFNKDLQMIEEASLSDTITEGEHSFEEGSLKVYKLHMNADGTIDEEKTEEIVNHGFGSNFPLELGTIDSAYRVVYDTTINDHEGTTYSNEASLDGENTEPVEAEATVTVDRGKPLEKSSTGYDASTQTIEWEIKYNYDEKVIPQNLATLTDVFGENQQLTSGGFEVYEVEIDPDTGEVVEERSFENFDFTETENGFEFQFNEDIEHAYRIVYETKNIERVEDGVTINNTVSDEYDNIIEGSRGIQQQVLNKSNDNNAHYDDKTTGWTVRMNSDEYTMDDVIFTDELPIGFTPEGIQVTHDGQVWQEGTDYEQTFDPDTYMLTLEFDNPITKEVIITYTTVIDFDKAEKGTQSYRNNALVEWTPEGETERREKEASATFTPDSYTIANGFKGGSYNAVTKEIDWEIGVNYNKTTLTNAIVEDYIVGDQNFDLESVRIFHMELTGGDNGVEVGEELDESDYELEELTNDDGEKGFRVNLYNIDTPYLITFTTDLTDQLIAETYDNTAVVKSENQEDIVLDASVSPYRGGEYTKKSVVQNDENPRVANWQVDINFAQSTVSNVAISDTPSQNHTLLKDTIKLYETKVTENSIAKDLEAMLEEGIDYEIEFTEDADGIETFTITLLEEEITRGYVLEYDTYIMYAGDGYIENDIKFEAEQTGDLDTDDSISHRIDLSGIGGGIDGEIGSLEVMKVDADDNEPLAGAEFTLYDETGEQALRAYTTGDDGKVVFQNLLHGDYILKETEAPEGYVVGIDQEMTVVVDEELSQVTVENQKVVRDVELMKVDSETNEPLAGVTFRLQDEQGNIVEGYENIETDENGLIQIFDLEPGEYAFEEVTPQEGYQPLDELIHFTIDENQTERREMIVENSIVLGSITLVKVDKDNENVPLEGAVFALLDADGHNVTVDGEESFTTDENGEIFIDNLRPGTYYFVEQQAPEHYVLDSEPIEVMVELNQTETAVVHVENELITGAVELTKTGENGLVLEGTVFELQDEEGNTLLESLTTDEEGKLVVANLKPGSYQFVERASIAGYELDQTPIPFEIELSQAESAEVQMVNELTPGTVQLTKVGEENEALEGAEFTLLDAEGNELETGLTTDENGQLQVELKPGNYQIIETNAPFGHDLDATPIDFEIEFNQQETLEITKENSRTTSSVELTKVGEDGRVLEGIVFELQDRDGNMLQEDLTTDAEGKLIVDGLKPGHYQFIETSSIAGYELVATPVSFEIELGQTESTEVEIINELTLGTVQLTKVGEENEALEGAEFTLLDAEGNELETGLTTDEDGQLQVELKPGTYYFVETKAPFGHELDTTPLEFEIDFNQQETLDLTKENSRTTSSVELLKVDQETKEPLEGTIFELHKNGEIIRENVTTNEEGKIFVNDLKPGTYQFIETQATEGYILSNEPISFTIELGQTDTLHITTDNEIVKGGIELTKVDADDVNLQLEGVEFELQDAEGNTLQTELKTDQTGTLIIDDLRPGQYVLVETKPLFGYESHEPIAFTIDIGQMEDKKITITNKLIRGEVELTKVAKHDESLVLAGAQFNLFDREGNQIKEGLKTGNDGKIVIGDLKPGEYEFVETKAPAGYKLDVTPISFVIEKGQTDFTQVVVTNEKTPDHLDSGSGSKEDPQQPENDHDKTGEGTKSQGESRLPKTATNTFNLLLLGVGLLIIGGTMIVAYRRRREI